MMYSNRLWANPANSEQVDQFTEEIKAASEAPRAERVDRSEEETFVGHVLDLGWVIDMSRSMNAPCEKKDNVVKSRWDVVKENLLTFCERMKDSEELCQCVHLTVMVFSTDFQILCANVRIADLDIDELMEKLDAIQPDGVTTLGRSIVRMVDVLNERKAWLRKNHRPYYQPILGVMSDGLPTNLAGEYSEQTMSQAYHQLDTQLAEDKITVLPVGIGDADTDDSQFKVLARLVKKDGDGRVPVLRSATNIRQYFRYIGQTVIDTTKGNEVDLRAFTRGYLNYKPSHMAE